MSFGSVVASPCHDYFHPANNPSQSIFAHHPMSVPGDFSGHYSNPNQMTFTSNMTEFFENQGPVENYYTMPEQQFFPSCSQISVNTSQYAALKAPNKNRINMIGLHRIPLPKTRVIKRRVSANKKERRRTLSINGAFSNLRDHIPFIPPDTKLSKIKTLRLATSYISYLMDFLDGQDEKAPPEEGFQSIVTKTLESRDERRKRDLIKSVMGGSGKQHQLRNRTGWPQHVWASELNQNAQVQLVLPAESE